MLNAMPLPIAPTESKGAIAKPEINRQAPDKDLTGEDTTSFASTLESVHKKNQPKRDEVNSDSDATSDAQSASEDGDDKPKRKDLVSSADGVFTFPAQEPTVSNNDSELKIATSNSETKAASVETPSASENNSVGDMAGANEKLVARPHQNSLEFVVPRQSTSENAAPQEGEDGHGGASPEKLVQEGASKLQTAGQKSGATVKSGMGAQAPETIVDQSYQASQIMDDVSPDRKLSQKAQQNAIDGLMKQDTEIDDTLNKPVLDEGQSQLRNKDNPARYFQHKGTESTKTEGETPTPGKLKAEVADFQTIRSQQANDATEPPPKPFGERVPETPMNMMSHETNPMADRQGGFDPMPSFLTSPSDGKSVMASGHTNATPVAMDSFQQENFHQLVERAMFTVRGEQSEARIALKPDHLGHVQMKIVTENNLVSVKIITETPAARDLIDANANQLKAELQHQGLNVENIQVSVSDERHDAYRQARQRESFMRQKTSGGQAPSEEDNDILRSGLAQRKTSSDRVAGIDYFA
jgi:flagellar hook-length control protein FliK